MPTQKPINWRTNPISLILIIPFQIALFACSGDKSNTELDRFSQSNNFKPSQTLSIKGLSNSSDNNLYQIKINNQYGFINSNFQIVIAPLFEQAEKVNNDLIMVKKKKQDKNFIFLNSSGKELFQSSCNISFNWGDDFGVCVESSHIKFYDRLGNIKFQTSQFSSINGFYSALAYVKDSKGYYGYINPQGEIVIKCQYNTAERFNEGVAIVRTQEGSVGIIDTKGHLIFPENPKVVVTNMYFEEGIVRAWTSIEKGKGRYGFINKVGKWVIPPKYKSTQWGEKDYGPYGLPSIERLDFFMGAKEGMIVVTDNPSGEKFGFINTLGETILNPEYDEVREFSGGIAILKKDNKWGVVNKKGEIVVPIIYESISDFKNGLAVAVKEGKYGYIDNKGNIVIPFDYDHAETFYSDLTPVWKNFQHGYINKLGEVIIPFQFSEAYPFGDNLALARVVYHQSPKCLAYTFINREGKIFESCGE